LRVLITTVQVPFVRGGAERHAENLLTALRAAGHQAEIVAIPYKWYPPERIPEHILACRLLDLTEACGERIDRVIGLKFPAYLIPHPSKVVWVLHQHRQAYEQWGGPLSDMHPYPNGRLVRDAIRQADARLAVEARAIYTNSRTVSERLRKYNGLDSTPLYHPPPNAESYYCVPAEDYLYFPSRLAPDKRQDLVLQALARTRLPVRVCFAGKADNPAHGERLRTLARELRVEARVRWLGSISEQELLDGYARARGVVYPTCGEDLGYITLEAQLSSKPVIICTDSGGPLEFVQHEHNGLIAEPTPDDLADAIDRLWENPGQAAEWGRNGRRSYEALNISWSHVVERLLQ
jgi:glycosyltransferase involved in cell wall biosynthesis